MNLNMKVKGKIINQMELYVYIIYFKGIYCWADGRRYEGGWKDSNMHGKGQYTWKDGRYYEGDYFNDKKHGYGIYRWVDGKIYEGLWLEG